MTNTTIEYRPDIDGLRALAVLAVVIYHAFPSLLPGGFVGVDIFFVISGFLMTSIIDRKTELQTFTFSDFSSRRIRRIFPALLLVLLSSWALGWFILLPDEYRQLGKHIFGSLTFVQNFILMSEDGYFNTATNFKPLMHLWSLSIEEQFYIFLPLSIVFARKYKIKILSLILFCAVISFAINLSLHEAKNSAQYFNPLSRFWEMLLGSIASYLHTKISKKNPTISTLLSGTGLSAIILSMFIVNKNTAFPGWWGLLPTIGTFLVIIVGPQSFVSSTLLSRKPLIAIGKISYPLYLWHWPLLSFGFILENNSPSLTLKIGLVIISIALSWATYQYIEKPFQQYPKLTKHSVPILILLCLGWAFVGSVTYLKKGYENRFPQVTTFAQASMEWDYPGKMELHNTNGVSYLMQRSNRSTTTLFIGDSNIEQFYPRVEKLIIDNPNTTNSAIFKTGGGCFPFEGFKHVERISYCNDLYLEAKKIAEITPNLKNIVIGSLWNEYLSEGNSLQEPIKQGSPEYKTALKKIKSNVQSFVSLRKNVFIILNIPMGRELDPKSMITRDLTSIPDIFQIHTNYISLASLNENYGRIRVDLINIAQETGAKYIDPLQSLCSEKCLAYDSDGPIYKDSTHLRPSFVRYKAIFIDQVMK